MKKLLPHLLFALPLFLIYNCGEKVREEIIDRYYNGEKKLLVKYKGKGVDEVIIERITFNENNDILIVEKPLNKMHFRHLIQILNIS